MARAASAVKLAAQNRKARHDYLIEDTVEAGIKLVGTEVKSLRGGKASIGEAFAGDQGGELYLFNAYIPEYEAANRFNHQPRRPRKLLLHKRQIEPAAWADPPRGRYGGAAVFLFQPARYLES